jgi:hypothetical protein
MRKKFTGKRPLTYTPGTNKHNQPHAMFNALVHHQLQSRPYWT